MKICVDITKYISKRDFIFGQCAVARGVLV